MFGKIKRGFGIVSAAVVGAAVSVGNALAVNPLTTEATTQLGDLQTDVTSLLSIMLGVVVTMAIAGIVYTIVKKK